ncbi:glycosyl transferase family protein [Acinetobacter puyangensis]|uniref:Anthranilate phosphoribosyltransferase n=1 Tax=Acinetobacter puyangensis TaxID=1096779 RepID=A0A240EA22_9GAMM|nr:glycosyl transferase family protein [Acinetobacter puyangensis]SNX45554.1 Anthranilate phosphoribosyltransferase [Acinetobacter puyangensis]
MPTSSSLKRNIYALEEHPFAQYVRILGKGKTGSRSLSDEEAYHAFSMILDGEALDLQIGAFLMLLRVKEESVDELTGFVKASKDMLNLPPLPFEVDLDWSSYAGKRKHYPWFLLSALTLAQHGYKVVMHGVAGHTSNRLYTEDALKYLGYAICEDIRDVKNHLNKKNFAFIPLQLLSPKLAEMIQFRQFLGLRSPVHTLCRLINPYDAKATLQAIFHPAYRASHQQAAFQLGYQNSAVIKGEGGEFERNPDAKTLICGIKNGECYELELPKLNPDRSVGEESFDLELFKQVWLGHAEHDYATLAIIETLAIALMTMQLAEDYPQAQHKALELWQNRFK